ncbi:hypothetical protein ACGF5F_15160 [Streptomyces sp. NPDC047821]|uniref:hypothetical protein n=1 Tax=Streptomyces sp. NPDC047821 TaxID=3365488 RepID=UPI00371165EE
MAASLARAPFARVALLTGALGTGGARVTLLTVALGTGGARVALGTGGRCGRRCATAGPACAAAPPSRTVAGYGSPVRVAGTRTRAGPAGRRGDGGLSGSRWDGSGRGRVRTRGGAAGTAYA